MTRLNPLKTDPSEGILKKILFCRKGTTLSKTGQYKRVRCMPYTRIIPLPQIVCKRKITPNLRLYLLFCSELRFLPLKSLSFLVEPFSFLQDKIRDLVFKSLFYLLQVYVCVCVCVCVHLEFTLSLIR